MNVADIILLFVLLISSIIGFRFGFIQSFMNLIKWCGSFAAPFLFASPLTSLLQNVFHVEAMWLFVLSLLLLFIGSFLLLSLLTKTVLYYTTKTVHRNLLNRVSGIVPGIIIGLLLSAILYNAVSATYWQEGAKEFQSSRFAILYQQTINNAEKKFVKNIKSSVQNLQVAGASETNALYNTESFQTNNFNSDTLKELELLQLVNRERIIRKLLPLQMNPELSFAAKLHGADMFTRGYFSHNTPEGKDPFKRLNDLNISYKYAGENLAYSNSVSRAHFALMQSPGHRANILNSKFSKLGISVLNGGTKGLIVIEEFKN